MVKARNNHLSAIVAASALVIAACGQEEEMYLVDVIPSETCRIDVDGTSDCSIEGLQTTQVASINRLENTTQIVFDEEVWVAQGGKTPFVVKNERRRTAGTKQCTSVTARELSVDADGKTLSGTYRETVSYEDTDPPCEKPNATSHLTWTLSGAKTDAL